MAMILRLYSIVVSVVGFIAGYPFAGGVYILWLDYQNLALSKALGVVRHADRFENSRSTLVKSLFDPGAAFDHAQ
jgi:hypothetical protein